MLTADYVKYLLDYDRETGIFTWKKIMASGRIKPGSIAGGRGQGRDQYTIITINKKRYKAHRLAWLIEHNEWPKQSLDHINGDGFDNRIANLRLCSFSENKANSARYKNNKTGFKGVFWNKKLNKFTASLRVNGKGIFLGVFPSKEEAAQAYLNAAQQYFGLFARAA
jgi:hypothetical protein